MSNEHRDPENNNWNDMFTEVEKMIQHGLNLMTISLIAAREALFGDDDKKDEQ